LCLNNTLTSKQNKQPSKNKNPNKIRLKKILPIKRPKKIRLPKSRQRSKLKRKSHPRRRKLLSLLPQRNPNQPKLNQPPITTTVTMLPYPPDRPCVASLVKWVSICGESKAAAITDASLATMY
jgi:hypothetical protein